MNEKPKEDELFGRIADLNVSPQEYYKLVGDFNLLLQQELSERLAQAENRNSLGTVVTLVTHGSDARLEKGSFASPLEVIAIVGENIDLDVYQKTLLKILEDVSPTKIAKVVEMKGPQSSLVTAYNNRYQPGRIADGRLVYGSQETVKHIKVSLGRQIMNLRNNEVDKIASLKRDARKVVGGGVNRITGVDAIHFDLKSGAVFFNPDAYQFSFKIGPLRLVQNTLLIEEVKHTRRENAPNFISELDSNIIGRLNQLSDDRMINLTRALIEEVSEHYAFFLRLYHKSERAYEKNKQVVVQLTVAETLEVSTRLQALSVLMDRFAIKK